MGTCASLLRRVDWDSVRDYMGGSFGESYESVEPPIKAADQFRKALTQTIAPGRSVRANGAIRQRRHW